MLRRGGPVTVRDVQRALGFRSPSSAKHHLDKLVELGLAELSPSGYVATKPKGLLAVYVRLAGNLVPRLVIAASALTGCTIAYILLPYKDPLAALLMALFSAWLWLESLSMLRAIRSIAER